jgi:hypothetical protein
MALKGSYRYPQKRIDKLDDYLEVLVVKYSAPGLEITENPNILQRTSTQALDDSGSLKDPLYQILLPMPQGISDTNMVKWGEDSINPLEAAGVGAVTDAMKGKKPVEALKNLLNAGKSVLTSGNGQSLALSYMSAKAVGTLGGNVSAEGVLARTYGQVLNPNMELLFQGVQLRSFNFSFNLAPREENEAYQIKQIIRTFKKSMAAKTSSGAGAGLFISSPEIFQLTYKSGNKKHPYLHSFKPCALVNMGVDYTGSGVYATYEDATPVHMKLSLSFQELNPIYFEDYNKIPLTDGVGY